MPTVRCPSCGRALRLPDHLEAAAAQCPLCQATFDAVGQVVSGGRESAGGAPYRGTDVPRSPRRDDREDEAEPPEVRSAKGAVLTAGWWLKTAGLTGLLQLVFCSCIDLAEADAARRGHGAALAAMLARGVALIVVWSAGDSLTRRRSVIHAGLGAAFALAVGVYMAYRALPGLARMLGVGLDQHIPFNPYNALAVSLFVLFCLAVSLPSLVGSIWTFAVLCRPSARALFAR